MTTNIAREKCNHLRIGDRIIINEVQRDVEGRKSGLVKIPGIILSKYPNHLLIGKGEGYRQRESYTYIDIALNGCIEKMKGRPSKV